MSMEVLRLASLKLVKDGQLERVFDQCMAEAFADCIDRPLLDKPRKVILEVTVTPDGQDDPLREAVTDFKIDKKFPAQQFGRRMKASPANRGFLFDVDTDNIDHDIDQRTFDNH